MAEGDTLPGQIVVGADSHTCTLGAFGAFATGVGATDMAAIWASGTTWFRVPDSIGIHLTGSLCGSAEAKVLALTYVARLGMDGASYHALEFIGEGVSGLSMDSRLTLSNLAVEAGAKAGLFYADPVTCRHLGSFGHRVTPQDQADCNYQREFYFDEFMQLLRTRVSSIIASQYCATSKVTSTLSHAFACAIITLILS